VYRARKGGAKGGGSGRDPGGFVALPWTVLDSPAYKALSHPAKALLFEFARQFVRDNNGRLLASSAHLAARGWRSNDVIGRAKRELLSAGFIFETVKGQRPNKASWYAVTWLALNRMPGFDPGAAELFQRGAYRQGLSTSVQCAESGPPHRKSTTKAPIQNAKLKPSNGVDTGCIAPPGGVRASTRAPSDGAVQGASQSFSAPAGGNHLEKPSIEALGAPVGEVRFGSEQAIKACGSDRGMPARFGRPWRQ
jgi:hypothetical protein